ncbi:hypothetical protein MELE44368_12795 [Mycolicibacterium elephantis DSM 44368]|uniref:Uncharacterized protein n=1 Tax=Mycolicibacterium elephantis DSM 44368 TaxID=1335622 RepID=A0A439DYL2_9MYCO|nr:hypothetical protein MELE44368_12795 [Mycolicibacterium elephantis DSM 44368]
MLEVSIERIEAFRRPREPGIDVPFETGRS